MTPQKQHKRLPKRVSNRRNWINTAAPADYDTRTAELESFVFCVSQFRWFLIEFILFCLSSAWFASLSLWSNHENRFRVSQKNQRWIEAISLEVVIQSETPLKTLPPHVVFCFSWFTRQSGEKVSVSWKFSLSRSLTSNLVDEKVSCASAQSTSVSTFIDLWNAVEVVTKTVQAGHNFLERKLKGNLKEKWKSGLGTTKFQELKVFVVKLFGMSNANWRKHKFSKFEKVFYVSGLEKKFL